MLRRLIEIAERNRGSRRVKQHITVGIVATSMIPLLLPEFGSLAMLGAMIVNLLWVWEG